MCLLDVIQEKRLHRVHFSGSIYSQEENNYIFATSPKQKKMKASERDKEVMRKDNKYFGFTRCSTKQLTAASFSAGRYKHF